MRRKAPCKRESAYCGCEVHELRGTAKCGTPRFRTGQPGAQAVFWFWYSDKGSLVCESEKAKG